MNTQADPNTTQLGDTTSPGRFLNTLDTQLTEMSTNAQRLPEQLRSFAKPAVDAIRTDLLDVTSHSELRALANRYAKTEVGLDPVTMALRGKIVEQVHTYLASPQHIVDAKEPRSAPGQEIVVGATRGMNSEPVVLRPTEPTPLAAQPTVPTAPTSRPLHAPQQGVQPRDLVLFRNGEDQTRWGIVDREHTNGAFVVRVNGRPTVVPAISITHTIDPRKQPDLPIDSIIEKGTVLPVRRVSWGENADRLTRLAQHQPAMRVIGKALGDFDLRDGIGTSNERAPRDDSERAIERDQRQDQSPDVDYQRNSMSNRAVKFNEREDTVRSIPTAGPQAMRRAAQLDDEPLGQTRILVTGSRDLTTDAAPAIKAALVREIGDADPSKFTVVHGASKGADEIAHKAARELGMRVQPFRADWNTHGKAAGPIRNQEMLNSGITKVLAFTDKPLDQSRGTTDMVGRARNAGIPAAVIDTTAPTVTAAPTVAPQLNTLKLGR
jgi:YspA, cpYpsA-related SLOG family